MIATAFKFIEIDLLQREEGDVLTVNKLDDLFAVEGFGKDDILVFKGRVEKRCT